MSLYDTLVTYNQIIKNPKVTDNLKITQITASWMKEIFGFSDSNKYTENIFAGVTSNMERQEIIRTVLTENAIYDPNTGILRTSVDTYNAGWFISPTVKEIKDLVRQLNIQSGTPAITIVQGKDVGLAHIEAQPYETFQGASQFNALEMVNIDITPYDGIEIYINDNTQGPRMALSCVAGTCVRNYYITTLYGSQFNALENLQLSHTNGYLIWGTSPQDIIYKITPDDIMIPCMIYTQLVGITKSNQINKHLSPKLLHQVYSSAVPINSYRNGGNNDIQLNIARSILLAEYIGTIGMGLILHNFDKLNNRTTLALTRARINLTLVGAGVFNVPETVVIDIIKQAIDTFNTYAFDVNIHGYTVSSANALRSKFNIQSSIQPIIQPSIKSSIQPSIQVQSINGFDDYVLIIPGKNNIEVFSLRPYQKDMLKRALHAGPGDYPVKGPDFSATIFVRSYPRNVNQMGFVGTDGILKYFVNIKTDPRIGSAKQINNKWLLYDKTGREITSWP